MRKAVVYWNKIKAGTLTELPDRSYQFRYEDSYLSDPHKPAIGIAFPKSRQEYQSPYLFPLFFNMLSEGVNFRLQSRQFRIDENDSFGLLLATARYDTIGAITIAPDETTSP